jgi:hypothetical protein
MNINKAIQHFEFKLVEKDSKGNVTKLKESFTPTVNDINAYNAFVEYHDKTNKQQLSDNLHFAKLYIVYYGELLKYYKSSVFEEIPQKELQKELDKPLDRIISEFVDKHNSIEQSKGFEIDGVLIHPRQWTKEQKELIKLRHDKITIEQATDNLIDMINLALK